MKTMDRMAEAIRLLFILRGKIIIVQYRTYYSKMPFLNQTGTVLHIGTKRLGIHFYKTDKGRCIPLLSSVLGFLINGPFLMLRLADNAGVFPKPLPPEEEKIYIQRLTEGDAEARAVLIERNLRLVAHIVKKYYVQSANQDDLISIGTIGLIKGISSYRPDRGVRLATYASRCIENEILMYFRSQKKTAGDISLSETIDTDKEGNDLSLMDVISIPDEMLDNIVDREMGESLKRFIRESLTETERKVIILRYGLFGKKPLTQMKTAQICGISRSYVSRIEKRALEKLRARFAECEER